MTKTTKITDLMSEEAVKDQLKSLGAHIDHLCEQEEEIRFRIKQARYLRKLLEWSLENRSSIDNLIMED